MTIFQSIILGILQGLTEFLPISSSAHLVLVPHLLSWRLDEDFTFPFNVLVQLGTLAALVIYYRQDLLEIFKAVVRGIKKKKPLEEEPARVGWLAILATIPAGLLGLLIKEQVEAAFNSPTRTALLLFATAGLLILAEWAGKQTRELSGLGWQDALWIGAFQALSIFPGISRSGSAISGGMTRQLNRQSAGHFAFLLAIPVMLAAGLLGIMDLLALPDFSSIIPTMVIGFLTAGAVGYFAIRWLIGYISSHSLLPFAGYCLILGAGSLLLSGLPSFSSISEPAPILDTAVLDFDSYHVAIEPDLEWLLPAMRTCQKEMDDLPIVFQQKAVDSSMGLQDDVFLVYGEHSGLSITVYRMGLEPLEVVVHPQSPLQSASRQLVDLIFSGKVKNWVEANQICPSCFASIPQEGQPGLYVYPSGAILREYAEEFFPAGFNFSSSALIAPGARQMREAIAADIHAVGFLPDRWADESVRVVPIDNFEPAVSIPILAYTGHHFDDRLAEWLICIQNWPG